MARARDTATLLGGDEGRVIPNTGECGILCCGASHRAPQRGGVPAPARIRRVYPAGFHIGNGMPVVTITMAKGRSVAQKKQMAEEIAGTITRVLDVPIERVTILIHELEKENIALSGILISEEQK
ncbi:MAG TPA: tautomerase family protein [Methanolinea sp.]|nr:tautomerase family protein [Methanolinea sp.]HQK55043.1 tautomerase family protein [Methanolinea sp.]